MPWDRKYEHRGGCAHTWNEGRSGDSDNDEKENDARKNPAKCLRQELDKDSAYKDDQDTVEGSKMMTGMEFGDVGGIGGVQLPDIGTSSEEKATEYFNMAHDLLRECKAACNISSLDTAIYLLECAAASWPPGDSEFIHRLNHLATALLIRFIYTADADNVHYAVVVQDRHEDVTSKDMTTSACMMLKEVLQAHNQATLETAILLYQEGLKLTPKTHCQHWRILWELSDALLIQYHLTGNVAQADEAVSCLRLVQQVKPNRSICLCAALMTGQIGLSHLVEGTGLQQEVLRKNEKALDLIQLGHVSMTLFEMHHESTNCEVAMRTWQEAELLLSWGHESRGRLLNNLAAAAAITRFDQLGDPKDIDEVISLSREALEIHAAPHPYHGAFINNLAASVMIRFDQKGDPKDIDEAITLNREALEIHAAPHSDRGGSLKNLAAAVERRFKQQGDPKDIDEAITLHREVLEIYAVPHPQRGNSLENLASAVERRFKQWGDPRDLDEAITLHREALETHSAPHPHWGGSVTLHRDTLGIHPAPNLDRGRSLNKLATAVQTRFKQWGDPRDIDEAITLHRDALEIHSAPHSDRGSSLNKLATALQTRFEKQGDPRDIDEAIILFKEALEIYAALDRGTSLSNLANAVQIRFEKQGDPRDIDEAITLFKEALEIHAAPDRGTSLSNLANAVQIRFEQQGDPRDLDEAITLHRKVLENYSAPHPHQGTPLTNLANAIQIRINKWGDPSDIDEAIILYRQALEIHAAPHPDRGNSLTHLAIAVQTRFDQQGDPSDIDEAITLSGEALKIQAAPHPDRGSSLNTLANAVMTRFGKRGDPRDIDEAITLLREALEIHAVPHRDRGGSLNNLANAVRTRFEQRGDPRDIDEAITLLREAVEIHAAPHPHRDVSLHNLAGAVNIRFKKRGDPRDIDEAITLCREALEIRAAPHPDRGSSLNNLAIAVRTRFDQRGDPRDLDEAITLHREVLEIYSAPHPHRGTPLTNLANAIRTRFEERGDPRDIDEAITLYRRALDIHAAPHPDWGNSLKNLAIAVQTRFDQQGDPSDIDEAITLSGEALRIQAAPHPDRGSSLNTLAMGFQTRFEQRGDLRDIDEAITLHREALEIHAAPYPDRSASLNNLANAVRTRFEQQGDPSDIDEAITLYRDASTYMHSSPLTRLYASHKWVTCAIIHDHGSSVDAYRTAINLLPQLAAFYLDLTSRHQMLARIGSLASASAFHAIGQNQNNLAVEFLEASRSIFWAQALQLRTPLDKLENVKPKLATKLRHLSQELEQASFRDTSRNISRDTQRQIMSIEAVAVQCRKLNHEWDETVDAVRKVPGFEDFLLPKDIVSLRQAAASGPIIILLAGNSDCSALIIKSSVGVQHVQLPGLNAQTLKHYADLPRALSDRTFNVNVFVEAHRCEEYPTQQSDLEARLYGAQEDRFNMSPDDILRRHLADIWRAIVKPVFEVLNLKASCQLPNFFPLNIYVIYVARLCRSQRIPLACGGVQLGLFPPFPSMQQGFIA
ncbi:hypothetical protein GGX14DRAFT_624867 [Mycena pura]|uniref:TPR-like protein n=1 Tax=Mycena pura TaxID=153505 RepID=A0AAD6YFM1_9AGAR|nr:hypothetical protein GGX14DRAFT_624867 [Mycena pura]